MRAELRSLHSPDAPAGLEALRPASPTSFALSVEATIGSVGDQGGDVFYFDVVGVDWHVQHSPGKGFRWGRGNLILDRWDPSIVERAIADLCRSTEGRDWPELAAKISRYGRWEFEDYGGE